MQPFTERIRSIARSRLAWLLACFHALWFFLAVANMSPPSPALGEFFDGGGGSSATIFAGRPFHFTYESILLRSLIVADLPSDLLQLPVDLAIVPLRKALHLHAHSSSYLDAVLLFVIATCQWETIGYLAQTWLAARLWGETLLKGVARHFVALVAFLAVVAVISVPIVNRRSREQGFHHPVISFR